MKFNLTPEQEMLQESLSGYLRKNLPLPKLRALFDNAAGIDTKLWADLMEMGIAACAVPEEFGGLGLGYIELALCAEILGRYCVPSPFLGHILCIAAIAEGGTHKQKSRFLPKLAFGEMVGSVAFAENGAVWNPEDWRLSKKNNGQSLKRFVPITQVCDVMVIGTEGGHLAVMEMKGTEPTTNSVDGIDRTRPLADVDFEDCDMEVLSTDKNIAEFVRDLGLVLLSADSYGAGTQILEMSVEYANVREQYGSNIGQFQGLKYQLVEMASRIEPCRGLYWYAAYAIQFLPNERTRMAAIAKSHICEQSMTVSRDAVEAHGGIAFTWESEVHIWLKRAMFNYSFMGTSAEHRKRVSALSDW